MLSTVTPQKKVKYDAFIKDVLKPYERQLDEEDHIPATLLAAIKKSNLLGEIIPKDHDEIDFNSFGYLIQEIGKVSSAILSLFTVHSMCAIVIMRWGTDEQKDKYLEKLITGELIGALALSEPAVGSDAANIETVAVEKENSFHLTGKKKWISCAQIADVFITITKKDSAPTAFIVERETEGLAITPIKNLLGFRGSMIGAIELQNVSIPKSNLLCGIGLGVSFIGNTALDIGRFCIAWGTLGMCLGCLESSLIYVNQRKQFGKPLKEHQLIQQMIADMKTEFEAAKLLCLNASLEKQEDNMNNVFSTILAKYYTSKSLKNISSNAVQIHGANGCSKEFSVERYYRDAKIIEIIEGSNQMQQIMIAEHASLPYANISHSQTRDLLENHIS